jgi:hypothetical protein
VSLHALRTSVVKSHEQDKADNMYLLTRKSNQ